MNKIYNFLCAAVLSGIGLSISNFNISAKTTGINNSHNNSNKIADKAAPVLINAGIAIKKKVPETLNTVGHVKAFKSVNLSFSGAAGKIEQIKVKDGQQVSKGDVIAVLDDSIQKYTLESSKAKLAYSKSNYDSYKKLSGGVGGVSANKLISLKSQWLQDQATVNLDGVDLSNMQLTVPFSGFLGVLDFHEGSYVTPGESIVMLQQINPVKINYSFPSSDLTKIQLAQSVNLTSSVLPGNSFSGSVSYRAQTIDQNTGTILLEASVKNTNFLLLPGMFVNVSQIINPDRVLLLIPSIALQTDIDGTYVYIIKDKHLKNGKIYGIAKQSRVNSEVIGADNLSILKGIKEGDIIVSAGQQKIHDGSAIIIDNTKDIQAALLKFHQKQSKLLSNKKIKK